MTIKKISQPNSRSYSGWFIVGPTTLDYCCDCGMAHKNQYRVKVDEKRKQVTIYMRTRVHVARTHEARKRKRIYKREAK